MLQACQLLAVSLASQIKVQYGDRKLQFRPEDITVSSMSRIFHLIPETIVLISEELCVPDSAGKFEVDFLEYKVEGDLSTIGSSGMTSLQLSEQPSTSGASNTSRWKPKAFPLKLKVSPVSELFYIPVLKFLLGVLISYKYSYCH